MLDPGAGDPHVGLFVELAFAARAAYGDTELVRYAGPKIGSVLIYPMATKVPSLAAQPSPGDIVLAVAWISPKSLKIPTTKVVQFQAKISDMEGDVVVPAN